MEIPYCNADCFQLFLNELSNKNPDQLKILIEDNGVFHKTKSLKIPDNIILIFQPPYSPELNTSENMWRAFINKTHKSLDEVSVFLNDFTKQLTPKSIIKTTNFEYVVSCCN